MKCYTVVAIALAVLGAHAQSRNDIPPCALPCIDSAVKKNTNCDTTNFTCICPKLESIQGPIADCVLQACGPAGVTLSTIPRLPSSTYKQELRLT
jgi:CFEM domain